MSITKKDLHDLESRLVDKLGSMLQTEIKNTKTELGQEMQGMKTGLQKEMQGMKMELRQEMQNMKTELRTEIKEEVKQGIDILRVLIEDNGRRIELLSEAQGPKVEKLEKHEKRLTTLEDYTYTKDRLR